MYEKQESKPEILKYEMIHVSSEDSNYAYAQRTVKDPEFLHGRGWVSSKYCNYPQEVVLKLRQRSNVERIELLCHHLYIPEKVEVFLGTMGIGERPSLTQALFKKLGYVKLADNSSSRHESREMKTITIDASGCFVKLMLHECYNNEYNTFKQVGLMSVTVIGYPLEPEESSVGAEEPDEPYISKIRAARASQGLDAFRYCSVCQQLERVNKVVKKKMSRANREDRDEDARMLGRRLDILKEALHESQILCRKKYRAKQKRNQAEVRRLKNKKDSIRSDAFATTGLYYLLKPDERDDLGVEEPAENPDDAYDNNKNNNEESPPPPDPARKIVRPPSRRVLECGAQTDTGDMTYAEAQTDPIPKTPAPPKPEVTVSEAQTDLIIKSPTPIPPKPPTPVKIPTPPPPPPKQPTPPPPLPPPPIEAAPLPISPILAESEVSIKIPTPEPVNKQPASDMCLFCGEVNETFTDAVVKQDHWRKICPMLTICQYCKRVIEVSVLTKHQTINCKQAKKAIGKKGKNTKPCPYCRRRIPIPKYHSHVDRKLCIEDGRIKTIQCPLCEELLFDNLENTWRKHLIGATGCVKNPRKMYGIGMQL